ncbi:COG1470 family protein [Lignipirellula cremea]|uniref:Lipoprotein n=1 Tax=Lignipirellula cremea TaxID=2528010 RepID=A0A518DLL7_9BACT|nr:hypothetical protein [Lignipirellula cremea]QDU92738.1 hypothetical protein Pla8534_04870 [Lignipirellula cremea]
MKRTIATLAMLIAAGFTSLTLIGCSEPTEKGGPGATTNAAATKDADGHDHDEATFTLTPPDSVDVEAGKDTEVAISVDRGDEFKQKVTITFEAPEGVTLDPTSIVADKVGEDQEVKVIVRADAAMAEGKSVLKVMGKPETGDSVDKNVTVNVSKPE